MNAPSTLAERPAADGADPQKRRQILAGAREVFLAKGYEGASMDGIAKAAGVSKGTLYVYFDNKESLFEALILEEKAGLAENLFDRTGSDGDLRDYLVRLGRRYLDVMARPAHIQSIRMVIGAVERFPEIGRTFYGAGPAVGVERLTGVFAAAVADGRLRRCDPAVAAGHYLDLCGAGLLRRLLFDVEREPDTKRREALIEAGVDAFLKAYGP